jgi:hypothetical protein
VDVVERSNAHGNDMLTSHRMRRYAPRRRPQHGRRPATKERSSRR